MLLQQGVRDSWLKDPFSELSVCSVGRRGWEKVGLPFDIHRDSGAIPADWEPTPAPLRQSLSRSELVRSSRRREIRVRSTTRGLTIGIGRHRIIE